MKVLEQLYRLDRDEIAREIVNPNCKLVILLSGPAGVGKSTFARKLMIDLARHRLVGEIFGSDDLRWEMFHSYDFFEGDPLMWKELYRRVNACENVAILDATYTTPKSRARAIRNIKCDMLIGINLSADLETVVGRNAHRDRKVPEQVVRAMCARNTLFTMEEVNKYGYALAINVSTED